MCLLPPPILSLQKLGRAKKMNSSPSRKDIDLNDFAPLFVMSIEGKGVAT